MKHKIVLAAIASLAAASIGGVYAAQPEEHDAAALAQAKISLTQAIASAERHAGGKAVRAELEDENGKIVYGVEVIAGANVTDVKVDVDDGKVLSAQADDDEHEGLAGEDREEGERGDR